MPTITISRNTLFGACAIGVLLTAQVWLNQVSEYVPSPYLDEIFHIPQARAYCKGNYEIWDDKITTPPGLYMMSNIAMKLLGGAACTTYGLRHINTAALMLLFIFAVTCRRIIESIPSNVPSKTPRNSWIFKTNPVSSTALHTGFNIALFPPLFFFSGLYYTDIISTALVLFTYCYCLSREGAYNNSSSGGLQIFTHGILALTLRQTNIFWVAVFMAGLELVRTVKNLGPFPARTWKGDLHPYKHLQLQFEAYERGELHDVTLEDATLYDCILCTISLAIAAISNLNLVITRLWPYLALLSSFGAFIIWNGGVVLGDKSNHIATIHLPQMLYIWPLFVFFSMPLLYTFVLNMLKSSFSLFTKKQASTSSSRTDPQAKRKQQLQNSSTYQSYIISLVSFSTLLAVALAVIHYNTIIHPFTLADNRHYMFYVFRYSIRAHPLIRYLLAPVYLFCGWLVFCGLSRTEKPSSTPIKKSDDQKFSKQEKQESTKVNSTDDKIVSTFLQPDGNTTSFALIWVLSTALSLITAPLVEPRYFIIPWVMWRLHVPLAAEAKGHDRRLWFETLWFLVINTVTGYVFLFKGFEWPQEPGKVQRFMW